MTTTSQHPLAAEYLDRLARAARKLPRSERGDLTAEIDAHLSEAIEPGMSDAEVLTVLDRLGEPEDIVAAQRPDEPAGTSGRGIHEWAAIFLLLFGGFIFVVAGSPASSSSGAPARGAPATS
jgi:HAAS